AVFAMFRPHSDDYAPTDGPAKALVRRSTGSIYPPGKWLKPLIVLHESSGGHTAVSHSVAIHARSSVRGHTISRVTEPDHDDVIIGDGFGGIGAAISLDRARLADFLIVEEGDGFGG